MRIGLEGAYSEYLSGKSGLRLMQKIADGQWKPIRPYYEREPVVLSAIFPRWLCLL